MPVGPPAPALALVVPPVALLLIMETEVIFPPRWRSSTRSALINFAEAERALSKVVMML